MIIERPVLLGQRKSADIAITVAGTATLLYQVPAGRTIVIRKIWAMNNNTSASVVTFWTSTTNPPVATFRVTPGINVALGSDRELREADIPRTELSGYVFAQATVAGVAPAEIDLLVEWDEYPAGNVPSN